MSTIETTSTELNYEILKDVSNELNYLEDELTLELHAAEREYAKCLSRVKDAGVAGDSDKLFSELDELERVRNHGAKVEMQLKAIKAAMSL